MLPPACSPPPALVLVAASSLTRRTMGDGVRVSRAAAAPMGASGFLKWIW